MSGSVPLNGASSSSACVGQASGILPEKFAAPKISLPSAAPPRSPP